VPHQVEVRVPDVGDAEEVEVIEILFGPGDRVEVEDPIVTLESDKATLELPALHAGSVISVAVAVGDRVEEGTLLLVLEVDPAALEEAVEEAPASSAAERRLLEPAARQPTVSDPSFSPQRPPVPPPVQPSGKEAHAGPGVRRIARELGLDLALAEGSGPHGRILEDDVKRAVRTAIAGAEPPLGGTVELADFTAYGEVEVLPLNRIRKVAARNLSHAWRTVPHVTQHDEADLTRVESFRQAHAAALAEEGVRLSPLIFAIKATAIALRDFPRMRSSLLTGGEAVAVKEYFHLGVAVDTEFGLVVPVIRDVMEKSLRVIAVELAELAERARERKLRPEHFEGAVFSISSLGGIGGTAFTPIVNAPEVGILGLSRTQVRATWDEEEARFAPRPVLPISLSYDHRVIDGAEAVRFTREVARLLSDPAHLLL